MPLSVERGAVEGFLDEETGRLDAGDFAGWVDLCTDDAIYWMPVSKDQQDPLGEISLLYENRTLMELRKFNFGHRLAPSFESRVVCSHIVAGVRVVGTTDDEAQVRAKFHCVMWYRNEQRIFAGEASYRLVCAADGFKIRLKRVDLINADAWHKSIPIYL